MAVSWGSYVGPGGIQRMRIGWQKTDQTPSTPTSATTSVDVEVKFYFMTDDWGVQDPSNSFAVSGTGDWDVSTRSVDINNGATLPGGTSMVIYTMTRTVALTYGATQTYSFTATLSGINTIGSYTATVSGSVTIPARPYAVPSAPTSISPSRTSDTSHTVTWTRNATTGAPYTSQKVQRRIYNNGWGAWADIATVASTATTYTDTGTVANRGYQWRIVAVNSVGTATSSASTDLYTTPAAPSGVTAAKDASGNIVITYTNNAAYTSGLTFEVDDTPNGGGFSNIATGITSLTTYTHSSPNPAQTHAYRVRAKRTGGTTLTSANSATSNTVQLLAAPNAPTNLSPSGVVRDATGALVLTWHHNPVDSTPQTKYQIRHRVVGAGSWTTGSVTTSSASTATIAASTYSNGDLIEWQVLTYGSHASASPFSASAQVQFYAVPTAAISDPSAGGYTQSAVTVTVGYYQAQSRTHAATVVRLYQGATLLETKQSTDLEVPLTTAVADGVSYTIEAQVQSVDGQWSDADSITLDVDYLPPEDASLEAEWDQQYGRIYVTVTRLGADDGVTVDAVSVSLYRSWDDGDTWILVHDSVPFDGEDQVVLVDPHAHTTADNLYRAILTSDTPSSVAASEDVTLNPNEGQWSYFCYGPGFQNVARCFGNLKLSASVSRDRALVTTAGRESPVVLNGTARERKYSVSAMLDVSQSSRLEWEDAAADAETGFWREPSGRAPVAVVLDVDGDAETSALSNVSLSMVAVTSPLPAPVTL